jgi:hypothetical protein
MELLWQEQERNQVRHLSAKTRGLTRALHEPYTQLIGNERSDRSRFMASTHVTILEVFPFHELWEPTPGFGMRQSSVSLAMEASQPKAPEDWRSPRRYRAIRRLMVPMRKTND